MTLITVTTCFVFLVEGTGICEEQLLQTKYAHPSTQGTLVHGKARW